MRSAVLLAVAVLMVSAFADQPAPRGSGDLKHGEIAVHLKGHLNVIPSLPEAPAYVMVAGQEVTLDCTRNPAARTTLKNVNLFDHGDLRIREAEVTGRMVFRKIEDIDGFYSTQHASSPPDTLVPVVRVDRIQTRLVSPTAGLRADQG